MTILSRRIAASIGAIALIAGSTVIWMATPPKLEDKSPSFSGDADLALIRQGSYIARLGDCVACHTEEGGAEMAGGARAGNAVWHHAGHQHHPRPENRYR